VRLICKTPLGSKRLIPIRHLAVLSTMRTHMQAPQFQVRRCNARSQKLRIETEFA
jgi:hypothetical protein